MLKRLLFSTTAEPTQASEVGMTVLRVFAGLAMAFSHGLGKLPPNEQLIGGVASLGFPAPELFAWSAALSEFIGGLLVAIGLCTRPAAFLMGFTMLVAAFAVHAADPFQKKEMALLYLVISIVFITRGAGRYSIDRFLSR